MFIIKLNKITRNVVLNVISGSKMKSKKMKYSFVSSANSCATLWTRPLFSASSWLLK